MRSESVGKDVVVQMGNDCVHEIVAMQPGTCTMSLVFKKNAKPFYDFYTDQGKEFGPQMVVNPVLCMDKAGEIIEQIIRAMND